MADEKPQFVLLAGPSGSGKTTFLNNNRAAFPEHIVTPDAFLDQYLDHVGDTVCSSVGAYHLEGLGIQLFERIDGDYFTILGMPLLPLLVELRRRGAIAD